MPFVSILKHNNGVLLFEYYYYNKKVGEMEIKETLRREISSKKGIFLLSIYVDERYRGSNKKFGSRLLNYLIEYAKKNDYAYILTDDSTGTNPPRNIYYKFGFMVKDDDDNWVKWNTTMQPDEERLLMIE